MTNRMDLFRTVLKNANIFGFIPKEEYMEPGSGCLRIIYTVYQLLPLALLVPVLLSQFAFLYRYWGDTLLALENIGMIAVIMLGIWSNIAGIVLWRRFLRAMKYLEDISDLPSDLVEQNANLKQILLTGQQKCHFFIRAMACSVTLAFLFWITTPFIIRYLQSEDLCQKESNQSLTPREMLRLDGYDQFSFLMWLPVDATAWYTEIWTLQMLCYLGAFRAMFPFSQVMIGIFVSMAMRFEIIAGLVDIVNVCKEENTLAKTELQSFEETKEESGFSHITAKHYIKSVIKIHQITLQSSKEIDALQAPCLGISLVFIVVVIITSMYQLTMEPTLALKYALTLAAAFLHIYIYGYFGECIIHQCNRIGKAVYESNWYERSSEFKRLVYMLLLRCQRPCVWTIFYMIDIQIVAFADITSMCYRVFMLLLRLEETRVIAADSC